MQPVSQKHNSSLFFLTVCLLGLLNIYGTRFPAISLIAAIVEYIIVVVLLIDGNYAKSFIYYIAFMAITLDTDIFIYGQNASQTRFTFAFLPFFKAYLRWIIVVIYFIKSYNEFKQSKHKLSGPVEKFKNWLIVLFIFGTISVVFGLILNDNGVLNHPDVYPKQAFISIVSCFVKFSVLFTSIFLLHRDNWASECSKYLILIIMAVAVDTLMGALLGFTGAFGSETGILLSTHAIAVVPLLLLFVIGSEYSHYRIPALILSMLAIVASFLYGGTMIGSKWYIIIAVGVIGVLIIWLKIKSVWMISALFVLLLLAVPFVIEPILSFLGGGNSFVEFKLAQALGIMNVFGSDNISDWYYDMGNSPLQRFDELHNTFIEYVNKPWFAIFGKGLGGTTQHYTSLLSWGDLSDYTLDQIQMGAFYRMHETLAVLFLQHGIIGVVFFIQMIVLLVKRLFLTPWALVSFVWFFFYWDYGSALILGGVSMALTLNEQVKHKHLSS